MNKIALAAAVMAFPAITFAGGMGNADLFDYMKNFDPSRAGERVVPVVAPIGSMIKVGTTSDEGSAPTTNRAFRSPTGTGSAAISSEATNNRLNFGSDYDLLSAREQEARKKLLRLRSVSR